MIDAVKDELLGDAAKTIKRLREELKKANQRYNTIAVNMGIRMKALQHVKTACCPDPICDKDNGKGWCPIRRALKRKPEES